MLPKFLDIAVGEEPFGVVVAEVHGAVEGGDGFVAQAREAEAAGEVVVDEGIAGEQGRELIIHAQTVFIATAAGVVVTQNLEHLDVAPVAPGEALEEGNLNIEIALLAGAEGDWWFGVDGHRWQQSLVNGRIRQGWGLFPRRAAWIPKLVLNGQDRFLAGTVTGGREQQTAQRAAIASHRAKYLSLTEFCPYGRYSPCNQSPTPKPETDWPA